MLARFFNDYEEIKDSTNKNRAPQKNPKHDATAVKAAAPVAAEGDEEVDVDMDEDVEEGGVKLEIEG